MSDALLPHTDVFINFQFSQSADSVSLDEHLMTDVLLFFFLPRLILSFDRMFSCIRIVLAQWTSSCSLSHKRMRRT